jgi:ADP-heptose:LPS heptosyltransferase
VAVDGQLILILRALGLGDLLTAVPALRGLARAFPEHRRVLLAPRALEPLLGLIRCAETGEPVVHELRHADLLGHAALARASVGLAGEPLDVAVNLHGRGPESHRALLHAAPRRMIAFANPRVSAASDGPRWRAGEHEVARWCRMLEEFGVPCDSSELSIEPPVRVGDELHGVTVIHPGASSAARRWPPERWAAIAAAERMVGRRVIVTGSRSELSLARRVADGAGLPPEAVLAGRTSVDGLARLVSVAGRVVCTDTGMGHLATALGTPSVLLFGPVSPAEWGPPAELRRHVVLWAGSRGDPHAARADPGLLRIKVADVLDALERLPARVRAQEATAPARRRAQGPRGGG